MPSDTGDELEQPFQLTSLAFENNQDNPSDPLLDPGHAQDPGSSMTGNAQASRAATTKKNSTAENKKKPKAKKTNPQALAHTNFRKLKIKNQNSKGKRFGAGGGGGGGGGRRFGNAGGRGRRRR